MPTIYDFSATTLQGKTVSLSDYADKVILIVNTASKCGFTPQYAGLEELYKHYKDRGLVILGFPCDQFGHQEPGADKDIAEGCLINYGVSFPMFSKIEVNGAGAHPLYKWLKSKKGGIFGSAIKWNFTKFLVDRNGHIVKRFAPAVEPKKLSPDIERIIKQAI